jgi:hypothetical protein
VTGETIRQLQFLGDDVPSHVWELETADLLAGDSVCHCAPSILTGAWTTRYTGIALSSSR